MADRRRPISPQARDAAALLGLQIREARVNRGWPIADLAERAGISSPTLRAVERGEPTVGLGTAFEVATLVGVPLFFDDTNRLAPELARQREIVRLIPQRVRRSADEDVDDDF